MSTSTSTSSLTKTTLPAIATLALFASGCILKLGAFGLSGTETKESSQKAARYEGTACGRVYYDLDQHDKHSDYNRNEKKFPLTKDPSPATQILLATCARRQMTGTYGHEIKQWSKVSPLEPEKVYYDLDDRNFDILSAAISSVVIMNDRFERFHRFEGPRWIGLVRFYAEAIDRKELASSVKKLDLPEEASAAFLIQYDDAVKQAGASSLNPGEERLLVDVPVATLASRQEHFEKFEAMYDELDSLRAKAEKARGNEDASEKVISSLKALRGRFLAECAKPECRAFPLWAYATKELALLHVARSEALDAEAESTMQTRQGSYVADLPQAIRVAQAVEAEKLREARKKYKKALDSGVDEKTALSIAGGSPGYEPKGRLFFEPKTSLPNFAQALDDKERKGSREVEYPVALVQPAGDGKVKLTFEKDTYQTQDAYNCRTTNRVVRIRYDGTLDYEEICNYRPRTVSVERQKPLLVPADEAKLIKKGDSVRLVRRKDEARVIQVTRDKAVIQIRGDALGKGK